MKNLISVSVLGALLVGLSGCEVSHKSFKIRLYSGGKVVGEWTCFGGVAKTYASDSISFDDSQTKRSVQLSGTWTVEEIP